MLTFDEFGNLTPGQPIESDLKEIKSVLAFNEQRLALFRKFSEVLDEISGLKINLMEVWVDGSFATLKAHPADVDVVFFLDFQQYNLHQKHLKELKKRLKGTVDCHFVSVYSEKDKRRSWYESDRIEFLHLFSTNRAKQKKGFVKILF